MNTLLAVAGIASVVILLSAAALGIIWTQPDHGTHAAPRGRARLDAPGAPGPVPAPVLPRGQARPVYSRPNEATRDDLPPVQPLEVAS